MFWFIFSLISAVNGLQKACTARAGVPLIGSCDARDYAILGASGECVTPSDSGDKCAYTWKCSGSGLKVTVYDGETCDDKVFGSATLSPSPDSADAQCYSMPTCQYPDAIGSIRESEYSKCCSSDNAHPIMDRLKHLQNGGKFLPGFHDVKKFIKKTEKKLKAKIQESEHI